ncbi:hypothetical protein HNY73_007471 [Argiope bruennichi]|uniref:DNA-directed DNA polymerase n=1 Tax=Argiope bruennichi TaxID=94029 RepID=A0A8T0FJJ0_ARGBR|nr:hypothetical protein HNY73_007471 [Argiope bruennichi]
MSFHDSDNELLDEYTQEFFEASEFFENLPLQFGSGIVSDRTVEVSEEIEEKDLDEAIFIQGKIQTTQQAPSMRANCFPGWSYPSKTFIQCHSICLGKNQQPINAMRDHKLHPPLENRARELYRSAGVPLGTCAFKEVALFENHLDVQVVVISSKNLNQVAYKERYRSTRINLSLHDGHTDYYCEKYDGAFQSIENHRCPNACHIFLKCSCILTEPKRRLDCNSLCQSEQCFTAHKALVGNKMLSICERMYQCRLCCAIRRRDGSFSIFHGQFITGWLLQQGIDPDVIPNGSKLMSIKHSSLDITIIDSMSFLPMALSKLTSCFALNTLKKGYFPHLFKLRENPNYAGLDLGFLWRKSQS